MLGTFVLFWPVYNYGFLNYDDPDYVTSNPTVQKGITTSGIGWAFSGAHAANWHPLTWISHMLDCQFFGMDAGWHHLTNLLLHALNAALLFLILQRMTRAPWRSAFVAAIFAWHPLRLESVVWIAERKDVLSTFFWMLTTAAYICYTECPRKKFGVSRRRVIFYSLALLFFALGLMAKPMLVTLPFVLLLLDIWPLRRLPTRFFRKRRRRIARRLVEKLPFFGLSAIACIITIVAQNAAIQPFTMYSVGDRVLNAFMSYARYIWKIFWPVNLSIFYPHSETAPAWEIIAAALMLLAFTAAAIRWYRRRPYFAVGWFWYLGTLLPVINLIQIGTQSMADRYTYIPGIGLAIIFIFAAYEFFAARERQLAIACAVVVAASAISTRVQLHYWRTNAALFEHSLAGTKNNSVANFNSGVSAAKEGNYAAAISFLSEALRINPGYTDAHYNLGLAFYLSGKIEDAIREYRIVAQETPGDLQALLDLSGALSEANHLDEAETNLTELVRVRPESAEVHYELAVVLAKRNQPDAAMAHFSEATRLDPGHVKAHLELAKIFLKQKKPHDAELHLRDALQSDSKNTEAARLLEIALDEQRKAR